MFRTMFAVVMLTATSATHAGVPTTTVITHGFSPDSKGVWIETMSEAILMRTGGVGTVYRYSGESGVLTELPELGGDGSSEHIILIFNWVPESDAAAIGPNWNYAQAAGDALNAVLRDPAYADGARGPQDLTLGRALHLIGHSRGTCVISEAIRRLALAGVPVDQMTTHDPHPVNGTLDARYNLNWGDPVPTRWSNVAWADNYWRADGGGIFNGLDFDGIPLANVFNTQLSESTLNCCAYFFAHSDVHLWYHGTIDLSPTANDGEQAITAQMRSTWWPQGDDERGFFYSALGGGWSERPAISEGVDPPADSAPLLENGSFTQGTYAGWSYHGGSGATVVNLGGNWAARLNAVSPTLVHNRTFVPDEPLMISMLIRRVGTEATDDLIRIGLQRAEDPAPIVVANAEWTIAELGGAFTTVSAAVPPGFLGRTSRLHLIVDGAGDGVNSTVEVDDLALLPAPLFGDLDGDGQIDGADLGALLSTWGPCAACPADLTGDGVVDGADLGELLANWSMRG